MPSRLFTCDPAEQRCAPDTQTALPSSIASLGYTEHPDDGGRSITSSLANYKVRSSERILTTGEKVNSNALIPEEQTRAVVSVERLVFKLDPNSISNGNNSETAH